MEKIVCEACQAVLENSDQIHQHIIETHNVPDFTPKFKTEIIEEKKAEATEEKAEEKKSQLDTQDKSESSNHKKSKK